MRPTFRHPVRQTLAAALIVTRREVRDQLRDWRIITPIVALTLVFPLLMNVTASQAVAFVQRYGAPVIGDRLVPFLLMIVGFFPISISLVIALESFVGEKERHSLEPLLASPLTDTELYLGKTLAAMLPPLAGAYLGIAVYLTGLALTLGWLPSGVLLVQILVLTTVQALVMVSGAVVISAQTTSVRAANLLASFIIIPMALLVQGESLIMFWARYNILWWVILGLALVTLVLIRMGVRLFSREEVLGRDLDEINLRRAARLFAGAFRGRARGLVGWYHGEVFPTARRLAALLGLAAVILAAGAGIGYRYAAIYQLPLPALGVTDLGSAFAANLEQFGWVSAHNAALVFLVNLRAVALAAGLGAFTLGILGAVLLMAPFALVGFFSGQVALLGLSPLQFAAAFVLPHGIFEIAAALLQVAAILRLGASVLAPPPGRTVGEGFLMALADWAKVTLGLVVPLLAMAALAEVFLTPRVALAILGS